MVERYCPFGEWRYAGLSRYLSGCGVGSRLLKTIQDLVNGISLFDSKITSNGFFAFANVLSSTLT